MPTSALFGAVQGYERARPRARGVELGWVAQPGWRRSSPPERRANISSESTGAKALAQNDFRVLTSGNTLSTAHFVRDGTSLKVQFRTHVERASRLINSMAEAA